MLERFRLLEENILELAKFRQNVDEEKISTDKSTQWAMRYGLLESIQIVIDISCHMVSQFNLGNPSTYSECLELLGKADYLPVELTKKLVSMAGLRNLLAHEYVAIDNKKLFGLLDNLSDFREFAEYMRKYF
jgi:uncharacterized protein YutE (UPF0331/DUF86 family)